MQLMQLRPIAAIWLRLPWREPQAGGTGVLTAQKIEFQERLGRIAAGQGSSRATVFVGQDLTFSYVPRNRRRKPGLGDLAAKARRSLALPVCMALGVVSHGLALYLHWLLQGAPLTPANADLDMAKTALATLCLTVIVTRLLGLCGLWTAKLLGVAAGMLFFHNFVHAYPAVFAQVFSPVWVTQITAVTEPNSLLFRGTSIAF
jgi:hypothetical protein